MNDDYSIGVWETTLSLNLSRESIVEACETDCPTCVMVVDLSAGADGPSANPHQSPTCTLCRMIEQYAAVHYGADVITYSADATNYWRGSGTTLHIGGEPVGSVESADIHIEPPPDHPTGGRQMAVLCPFCGDNHVGAECPKNPRTDE